MTEDYFRESLKARGLLDAVVVVAEARHVTLGEIASRSQLAHVARARHEAMQKVRDCGLSFTAIGDLFDRDHSTVIAALRRTA